MSDPATGLRAIIAIHDTVRGPAFGGCRMLSYAGESEALFDALRLSQGMSLKNALADLPFGGVKAVILAPADGFDRRAMFLAFGRAGVLDADQTQRRFTRPSWPPPCPTTSSTSTREIARAVRSRMSPAIARSSTHLTGVQYWHFAEVRGTHFFFAQAASSFTGECHSEIVRGLALNFSALREFAEVAFRGAPWRAFAVVQSPDGDQLSEPPSIYEIAAAYAIPGSRSHILRFTTGIYVKDRGEAESPEDRRGAVEVFCRPTVAARD